MLSKLLRLTFNRFNLANSTWVLKSRSMDRNKVCVGLAVIGAWCVSMMVSELFWMSESEFTQTQDRERCMIVKALNTSSAGKYLISVTQYRCRQDEYPHCIVRQKRRCASAKSRRASGRRFATHIQTMYKGGKSLFDSETQHLQNVIVNNQLITKTGTLLT